MIKRRLFHHSIYFKSKKRPITSTCAVPLDPQPTSNDHTSLFQSLVHDLLRRGLLSSAQQAIQRFIASSPTVPDAVSAIEFAAASGVDLGLGISCEILRILVDLGEPLSALDFYHDHLIARGNCQERVIYVSALCEGGKTEAALACFKNVASAGCIPLLFTFNSLIKRLFQDGHFEDVKSLFEIMQNEGIVPNLETYLIMVNEYCKQEDLASAFGILDQMKEMGPKPNVMSLSMTASLLV
ncbi:hypothetical protein OIU77_029317 [Salix suchowensis]|uniref:Pentatricopeptide repeat-containing protein n=1 Tax=Salix suchowensis TaxID=1278906 RepID=A0ABQ9BN64_9ROSI|nr:hypothetical protein OIU77_029317 [Salix suchowensis]